MWIARLRLLVCRLLDSDLLLPEEAEALLAEINEFERSAEPGKPSQSNPHMETLEDILRSNPMPDLAAGEAKAIVHQILRADASQEESHCTTFSLPV